MWGFFFILEEKHNDIPVGLSLILVCKRKLPRFTALIHLKNVLLMLD